MRRRGWTRQSSGEKPKSCESGYGTPFHCRSLIADSVPLIYVTTRSPEQDHRDEGLFLPRWARLLHIYFCCPPRNNRLEAQDEIFI